MNLWIKNSEGKKDAVLTMALLGFVVVLVKVLAHDASFVVDGKTITFGTIDAGSIAAILGPTLGAYVSRRYTDKKYHPRAEKTENGNPG